MIKTGTSIAQESRQDFKLEPATHFLCAWGVSRQGFEGWLYKAHTFCREHGHFHQQVVPSHVLKACALGTSLFACLLLIFMWLCRVLAVVHGLFHPPCGIWDL